MQTSLTRQQRRAIERADAKVQARTRQSISLDDRSIPEGQFFPRQAFYPFFALPDLANAAQQQAEACLAKAFPDRKLPPKGVRLRLRILMRSNGMPIVIGDLEAAPREATSHVALMSYFEPDRRDEVVEGMSPAETIQSLLDQPSEIRIPTDLLLDPRMPRQGRPLHWLYNIRFDMTQAAREGRVDESFISVAWNGYVGTCEGPFTSCMQGHFQKMISGGGGALHHIWRQIRKYDLRHRIVADLSIWTFRRDEIFNFQERSIQKASLNPSGFNMIPGGLAGLKRLRELGHKQATLDRMEAIVENAPQEARPGFARLILPRLSPTSGRRLSYVPGRWVRHEA